MKKLIVIACVLAGFAACGTGDETGDVIGTDTYVPCTATATTNQAACVEIRNSVCARLIVCGTYPSEAECVTWWNANTGDCAETNTNPFAAAAKPFLQPCVCGLATASCTEMTNPGFETAEPSCGDFFTNM